MGNHWYQQDGQPLYTLIGANGKERDTTLADAKKLNLVPSVTTIMACAAKPGLDNYKEQQLLDATVRHPYTWGLDEEKTWKSQIIQSSRLHSKQAADAGTKIHDALEQYYLGNSGFADDYLQEICYPVIDLLHSTFGRLEWKPEVSFSHKLGFGGKVDMSADEIILDFKTKNTDDISKMIPYDDHGIQMAAYAVGLERPRARRYNLFISTQVPGLLNLTESIDFDRDWGMFQNLLQYWQLKNRYVSGS